MAAGKFVAITAALCAGAAYCLNQGYMPEEVEQVWDQAQSVKDKVGAHANTLLNDTDTTFGQKNDAVDNPSNRTGGTTANSITMPSLPQSSTPERTAESCVATLPVEFKIGQLIMPGITAQAMNSARQTFVKQQIGGVLLMTSPNNPSDGSILELKHSQEVPLLVATDEEGGTVQRFSTLGKLPSAAEMATTTTAQVESLITQHATKLKLVGIDVSFGTVVDVLPADGPKGPIGSRSFSSDPHIVTRYALASVKGWRSGGIVPVLKHWPGHGRATGDTHKVAALTPPLQELEDRDLLPYSSTDIAELKPGVMVGHLNVPGLTEPGLPASLSPTAIERLRTSIGAGRLIFSDALDMAAASRALNLMPGQAVARTLAAGSDIAVFVGSNNSATLEKEVVAARQAVQAAVDKHEISLDRLNASAQRVLAHKGIDPCRINAS